MDYSPKQQNAKGLPPFWPAGLPPVRPQQYISGYQITVKNSFQPFAENDEVDVADDDGEQQPAEQPTEQPIWSDELEPIVFEDDDNEPEELKRQKSCEAPTHRQRQEHIESNHATYGGWCDICIKARATWAPHRAIKPGEQARRDAEKDGPIICSDYFICQTMRGPCHTLHLSLAGPGVWPRPHSRPRERHNLVSNCLLVKFNQLALGHPLIIQTGRTH